jgi:hypothetical protein
MALNHVGPGQTIPLGPLTTGLTAGALYNVGSDSDGPGYGYWGIVEDDVIGTTEGLTTVDGRPILDSTNDTGDGLGDLVVDGVHELVVGSGLAQAGTLTKGAPVYASGVNTVAGVDTVNAGAATPATYGHVKPQSELTANARRSGLSLVGHVWRNPFLDLRSVSNTKGAWVVETKLLGRPEAGGVAVIANML